ncbi:hypothetical protein B0T21DRAFT_370961 [Apiosordaria backusii]|uniref:SHSP domain-containing protein n=1 Tax=Apiosordaria backusii TaxID=314023 RepID=A0AA40B823_9PEZI|nr:hypothetical protein B0T21DRAFT_370961 [Apiosordaria backusii]
MSFNGPEGQGRRPPPGHRPPPPPPGYGPQGFWDFVRSMTPNANGPNSPPTRPGGEGVDTQPPFPPFQFFGGPEGLNFNPSWTMPHHPPPPHHRGPGPRSGEDTADDSDGHHHRHDRHGRHGRGGHHGRHSRSRSHSHHRREPEVEEDLYDISAAAGAAEHDLMAAYDRAREKETEKDDDLKSVSTLRDGVNTPTTTTFEDEKEKEHPDPPEEIPSASSGATGQHGHRGRCRPSGCGSGPGRRGRCGRGLGGFGGGRHNSWGWGGGPHGFGFEFGRSGSFPPHFGPGGGFGGPRHASGPQIDIGNAVRGLGWAMSQHPLAKGLRDYFAGVNANQNGSENNGGEEGVLFEGEETFSPPADVFDSDAFWTVHLAIPGAKKQDVGVHWDKERGVLVVSGVVYRSGDEEFLRGLVTGERKVGLFERKIKMPPVETENSDEEVDGDGITAKLEDGVLIVAVPKRKKEKGTAEIKRVQVL